MTSFRVASAALLTLVALLGTASGAAAADPDRPAGPATVALQLESADASIVAGGVVVRTVAAEPLGPGALGQIGHDLRIADSEFRYRQAIRVQQAMVYRLATDPALEQQVLPRLRPELAAAVGFAIEGLRSLWRAAGIDDYSEIRMRWNRRLGLEAKLPELQSYYRAAADRYPVDWTYLASINYIESDFGRINGPSSAGAEGPMQFMPATWADFGKGGDVMSSHDSIEAAARYLNRMGAPSNMGRAIFRYNNDDDYVSAVENFAAALRTNPAWLDRLYYWSTAG